jgi:hypothetical protein
VSALTFTPELLRNGRIQLRRGRIVAVIVICAALSLSSIAYFFYSPNAARSEMAALDLVRTMILLQVVVLLIGGGIYCLQSVHREKELHTFDYQRITRLKPIELAVGKLLGAPALTYLVVLCLVPVTVVAAFVARISIGTLLEIYLILLLGSITYHSLSILLSLLAPAGSFAGTIVFYLVLIGIGSVDFGSGFSMLAMHQLSPFFVYNLLTSQTIQNPYPTLSPLRDLFLGTSVPHVLTLVVIDATFCAFFLLAVVRNIKRDPSVYEIYSPWQGLAFVLYLDALVLGFFRWMIPRFAPPERVAPLAPLAQFRPIAANAAEVTFLAIAMWLLAIFGLALLRNRERVRRRIRQHGAEASGWWAAVWPSPYLMAGAALTGLAILAMIRFKLEEYGKWNLSLGALQVAFLALWLARDFQYLQWMNLRMGRRSLVTGLLYVIVFYVCASACMVAFGLYRPIGAPYRAIFIPSAAFGLDTDAWTAAGGLWLGALLFLVIEALGFVWLQRRELQRLANPLHGN